jgi:hypothetical protein
MKTNLTFVALLATILFAGCPAPQDLPDPPDSGTTIVNVGDPTIDVSQTGNLRIKGDLYGSAGEKSLSYPELIGIGKAFKSKARYVLINVWEQAFELGKCADGKCGEGYYIEIPIIEGVFDGLATGIFPGNYFANVYITDATGIVLFNSETPASVQVVAGETARLAVKVGFLPNYYFRLVINSLPGQYGAGDCQSAKIVTADGQELMVCWWYEKDETVFGANLPLDFSGGTLVITDTNGEIYQSDLPLIVAELDFSGEFDFSDILRYDYTPVDIYGDIDIDIIFEHEQEPVIANGQQYLTIQDAIDDCESPVLIALPEGDFDGFRVPSGKSVSVSGLGPDVSRITNYGSHSNAVFASSYVYTVGIGKAMEKGGGGGPSTTVTLYNLAVINNPAGTYYDGAAVFTEGNVRLVMTNCAVESDASTVTTSYSAGAYINHCVLLGNVDADNVVVTGGSYDWVIKNSIILHSRVALLGTYWTQPIATYCCLFDYQDATGGASTDPSLILDADPLLQPDYRLAPGSPCVGTADDGGDIGLDWRG